MRIIPVTRQECSELLQRGLVRSAFSYEPDCIYIFLKLDGK